MGSVLKSSNPESTDHLPLLALAPTSCDGSRSQSGFCCSISSGKQTASHFTVSHLHRSTRLRGACRSSSSRQFSHLTYVGSHMFSCRMKCQARDQTVQPCLAQCILDSGLHGAFRARAHVSQPGSIIGETLDDESFLINQGAVAHRRGRYLGTVVSGQPLWPSEPLLCLFRPTLPDAPAPLCAVTLPHAMRFESRAAHSPMALASNRRVSSR